MKLSTAFRGTALTALIFMVAGCSDPPTRPPVAPIDEEEQPPPPPAANPPRIYVANADGSEVTLLTEGWQPAWSWDGRKVAFVREASSTGPAGIYVINGDSSNESFLGSGWSPAWSPDGRIAFVTWNVTMPGIHVMNADGTGIRLLRSNRWATDSTGIWWPYGWAALSTPRWSPDGTTIAFVVAADGGPFVIYLMNADGTEPRHLTADGCSQMSPAWAPAGSMIALWSFCYGIATVAATGGVPRPVYRTVADQLDWSPDGSTIAFSGLGEAGPAIWVVSTEGGSARVLIPAGSAPAWSPDGGRIAFVRTRDE